MNQFQVILLFARSFQENYHLKKSTLKLEIDNVVDPSSLAKHSSIIQARERSLTMYNICNVAGHIIDIRSLLLNYNAFFSDLYELFNKLLLRAYPESAKY